jgi:hypothetical protein
MTNTGTTTSRQKGESPHAAPERRPRDNPSVKAELAILRETLKLSRHREKDPVKFIRMNEFERGLITELSAIREALEALVHNTAAIVLVAIILVGAVFSNSRRCDP